MKRHNVYKLECNPGNSDQGSEWDWMTFFWDLYSDNGNTSSTRRWSVSEILSAWPDDSSDSEAARRWLTLYNGITLSTTKRDYFYNLSGTTGVRHYTR